MRASSLRIAFSGSARRSARVTRLRLPSGNCVSKTMSESRVSTIALPRPSKNALPEVPWGASRVAACFSPQIQSTTARMSPSIRAESSCQPIERVEAATAFHRIDRNDASSHRGARCGQHRRQFGGWIEGDERAAIAEQCRHANGHGLVGAGAGEDEAVGATPGEIEGEKRRLAALAPCCTIARIEFLAASGRRILVDAVGFADDHTAKIPCVRRSVCATEQVLRLAYVHPVGMAKNVGGGAFDRLDLLRPQGFAHQKFDAAPWWSAGQLRRRRKPTCRQCAEFRARHRSGDRRAVA